MFDQSHDDLMADVAGRNKEYCIDDSAAAANATYSLAVYQMFVRIISDATYTTRINLPSVREAIGKIYTICLQTDGGQDVTIYPLATDSVVSPALTSVTLADAGDTVVLYSNGLFWIVLGVKGLTITDYDV